jgi:hypothetical protein
MTVQHYFNSAGEWIGFRRTIDDRYLFDRHGNWVAWFPWNDNEAVDIEGNYLGTIVDGNRFYQRTKFKLERPHPGYSVPPGPTGYAGHPGYAAYSAPPLGYTDVIFKRSNGQQRHWVRQRRLPQPPKPTTLQIWMTRLGISQAADRIGRLIRANKS